MTLAIKKTTIQTKGRREFNYGNGDEKNRFVGSSEVNIISGGTTYHAGANIQIAQDGTISATDTKYTAGHNIVISGNVISTEAELYTAGENISISSGNVISTSANVHSDFANQIVICTQNAYDNMPSHDASTIYLILAGYINVRPGGLGFNGDLPMPTSFQITSNDNWTITIEYDE